MISLHGRISQRWDDAPFVVRLRRGNDAPGSASAASVSDQRDAIITGGSGGVEAGIHVHFAGRVGVSSAVELPTALGYLGEGDIVRFVPRRGEVFVLYRRSSRFNALLLTERCNSNCVMCSQPPKDRDDSDLLDAILDGIPLMSAETAELGITGGEPMLLGERLFQVIADCKRHLPQTALHMLSNGRLFNYLARARRLADIRHPDFVVGVPLYADIASRHDFVVQASGAFDQTVRGLLNLARCGVRIELRVVLHRQTVARLPQLARFIARNLPFVERVALMGLEMMGHVRMNLDALWIDPADYQTELRRAVVELTSAGMCASIYNHQLCVLDPTLWPYAVRSISDWKNEYLPACSACAVRAECGGLFSSAMLRYSARIAPVPILAESPSEPIT